VHSIRAYLSSLVLLISFLWGVYIFCPAVFSKSPTPLKFVEAHHRITLPVPTSVGKGSLEDLLQRRRTDRLISSAPISLDELSRLLWAAQGSTGPGGLRTAPSAGALYPLEIRVLARNILGLASGSYLFLSKDNSLELIAAGNAEPALLKATGQQPWVNKGAALIIVSGNYDKSAQKYGARAHRYVHLEAGHVAQNIQLQATNLGLATGLIGAFSDEEISAIFGFLPSETPLYLIPVGLK